MNNNKRRWLVLFAAAGGAVSLWATSAWADIDLTTKFTNSGSIANTRHNMTQRQGSGAARAAR